MLNDGTSHVFLYFLFNFLWPYMAVNKSHPNFLQNFRPPAPCLTQSQTIISGGVQLLAKRSRGDAEPKIQKKDKQIEEKLAFLEISAPCAPWLRFTLSHLEYPLHPQRLSLLKKKIWITKYSVVYVHCTEFGGRRVIYPLLACPILFHFCHNQLPPHCRRYLWMVLKNISLLQNFRCWISVLVFKILLDLWNSLIKH